MSDPFVTNATAVQPRSTRRNTLSLVLAALALGYVATRQPSTPLGWGEDFEAALAQAASTERPLLIAFYMNGCPPCAAMDREVLSAATVREAVKPLIPVRVNVAGEPEIAGRYGVYATPTYVIADSRGAILDSVMGYHSEDDFIRFLRQASSPTTASLRPSGTPSPPAAP